MDGVRGETLTVYRGGTDKYGNPNKSKGSDVDGVFAWASGATGTRWSQGSVSKADSSSAQIELYVKRGVDLRARDRVVRSNGEQYAVVGRASWDQDFPFDGYDFGYVVFQLEAMNG